MIAPIRAAFNRRVVSLVDARLEERVSELVEPLVRQRLLEQQTRSFALVDERSHPNTGQLWVLLRDLDHARLSIKFFGYELGRTLAVALPARAGLTVRHVGLQSKPSTQVDLESDWAAYWIGELKTAHIFHRKLWETAYVLQAIHENGYLRPDARGLGFGCGEEPLPSYRSMRPTTCTWSAARLSTGMYHCATWT